jgi:MFS family permease
VSPPSPRTTAPVADPTRRYMLLSFLQWLPVGLMMVPVVLLLLERGFTLGEVAAIGAVSAVTVAILELPTGGLADVVGRRPVLVVSALAHAAALLILGLAAGMVLLLLSAGLRGLSRALSTGPLEAWYVDTVQAMRAADDGTAHLTSGLARGEMAASVALGTGTLVGGALPVVVAQLALPVPALATPILLAAVVEMVRVGFTIGLPDMPRAPVPAMTALRRVPSTVGEGLRLAGRDRIVLRLLLVAATTGIALAVLELVTPAWLDQLVGEPESAAAVFAVLVTVGFGADALGAALAPAGRRRLSSPAVVSAAATAVALTAVLALTVASLLTGTNALLVAGVAYVVFFIGLGAAGPPLGELLHRRVPSTERTTVLSVQSLALQMSGAGGAVLAGFLTARQGAWLGFGIAAVALAAAMHLLLRMPVRDTARRSAAGVARETGTVS